MDNWTKPLNKHTCLDYHECYAKIVLEEMLPHEFSGLIIKDKPDLQTSDGSVGIEVTRAIDKDQLQAEGLYVSITYQRVRNEANAKRQIEKCGCKYVNDILWGKSGTDSFDLILLAVTEKLKSLNAGGYTEFSKNHLFIFSDIYADEEMKAAALRTMIDISREYGCKYKTIYVLVPGSLYVFDLIAEKHTSIEISSQTQCQQACGARTMVEAAEEKSLI